MLTAPALFLLGLMPPQNAGLTWVSLTEGQAGKWSARATYPVLPPDTDLRRYFNAEIKRLCDGLFYQTAHEMGVPGAKLKGFTLKTILSTDNKNVASALVVLYRTNQPAEFVPLTCWLSGGQPLRGVWSSLVRPGTSADGFANDIVLPALNVLRKANGLDPLPAFPPGLLDSYVVTQSNLSWIVPPGVAGRDGAQVKVPFERIRPFADNSGVLAYQWSDKGITIPIGVLVKWSQRDDIPRGASLQISLYRERTDPIPLGVQAMPLKDPPMEVKCEFAGVNATADDRLYLDVRITSLGQTLLRNKEVVRVPGAGWQTIHEIKLERERGAGETP